MRIHFNSARAEQVYDDYFRECGMIEWYGQFTERDINLGTVVDALMFRVAECEEMFGVQEGEEPVDLHPDEWIEIAINCVIQDMTRHLYIRSRIND